MHVFSYICIEYAICEGSQLSIHWCVCVCTANPTWGDIFESSKLKARTSLLPRFSEKRRSSFDAICEGSQLSIQLVCVCMYVYIPIHVCIYI